MVRVVWDRDVEEKWCVLYVTEMFKSSGTCCMLLGYLRGMARVLCDRDV